MKGYMFGIVKMIYDTDSRLVSWKELKCERIYILVIMINFRLNLVLDYDGLMLFITMNPVRSFLICILVLGCPARLSHQLIICEDLAKEKYWSPYH